MEALQDAVGRLAFNACAQGRDRSLNVQELGRLNSRKAPSHFLFLPLPLDPWQSQGLKSASYEMGRPFNKKLCRKEPFFF